MITSAQCRAARALLDWSQQALADAASVGVVTIRQFEGGGSEPRHATRDVIRRALETAGVEFIPENGGGPGVRLRKGKRPDDHPKPVGPATDAVDAMDQAIEGDRSKGKGSRGAPSGKRLASVKQEEWERFEAAGKKPGEAP